MALKMAGQGQPPPGMTEEAPDTQVFPSHILQLLPATKPGLSQWLAPSLGLIVAHELLDYCQWLAGGIAQHKGASHPRLPLAPRPDIPSQGLADAPDAARRGENRGIL